MVLKSLFAAAIAVLYLQPYVQFFGGWDPGVYVNTGISLARTGAITVLDREIPAVPVEERDLFLYQRRGLAAKYPGFVVRDAERGILQPYFNHLFPVWIAIFASGLGIRAGLYAGPVFALLSVGMLAVLGRVLFSRPAGAAAALLFGLSIPIIWSARFQAAEPVALFFSLGGWLAATLFLRGGRCAWAIVSALAFGCALLAKITTFLPVVLLLAACAVIAIARRDVGRAILPVALGVAMLAVLPYAVTAAREYTAEVFRSLLSRRGLFGTGLPLLAAAAAAAWIGGITLRRSSGLARRGAAATVAGLALYGFFVRPAVEHSIDAANLPQLGWFVTPLALALALGGVLACLLGGDGGRKREARLVFLAVAVTTATIILYRKQIAPVYLWALRRYVPEVLPALALFGAAALSLVCRPGGARRARCCVAAALLGAVCTLGLWRGRHLILHRDYAGAFERIEQVVALLPERSLTVCVDGWLAAPLQLLFERDTIAAYDLTPERGDRLARFLAARSSESRPIYLAVFGGDLVSRQVGLELAGRVAFGLPELARVRASYPSAVGRLADDVFVFRVVAPPGSWRPTRIAVAQAPFGLRGDFFQAERTVIDGQPRSFRWTGGQATLDLPAPPAGGDWRLDLKLGGGRPPGVPPPRVRVLIGAKPLATFEAGGPGINLYRFTVPANFAGGARELTLESDTFVPARNGFAGDRRALGVMLEEVALFPLTDPS
jgi:hypothetical protein